MSAAMNEVDRARAALNTIPPNLPRDEWHAIGRAAIAAGLTIDDIDMWSAPADNYKGRKDIEAAFKTIAPDGGTKAGTLFHHAMQYGFNDAGNHRTSLPAAKPTPRPQKPAKAVTQTVADLWARCAPATPEHGYIARKNGTPEGLRIVGAGETAKIAGQSIAGCLAVPCYSIDGELQTLQLIPPEGQKLNMPGASFAEGFFTVGTIENRIYICEGLGQAWAVHQVSGLAAVVCFGAGRMAVVARTLRAKYPAASLTIVPDKGKENQAAAIVAEVAGRWIEMPSYKPANYDANDLLQDLGAGALAHLLNHPKSPLMRFILLSDSDLQKLPPIEWRVKHVLPKTGLAALFGASGSGKSFAVIDLSQAIASGNQWFGYQAKQCNVLYCALEGEGGITGRVQAYRIRYGETSDNIRYMTQPFNLLDAADIADLAKAIHAQGQAAEVIILDTLNRAAPGSDENDSKSMGLIIAAAKKLQTLIGGLVILVHHTGKDATKGLRGHSSLHAALDAAIEVRRDGDRREWLIAKSKDGQDGAAHPFKLDIVELGIDEDGEPVTSCVVHPLEDVADNLKKALPPKSGNQRAIWDALGELFRKAGRKPEGAPDTVPDGRPCISLEAAIDQTRTRLVCDPKRQTERAQAAIRGLVDRGILCHEGGFLWCK